MNALVNSKAPPGECCKFCRPLQFFRGWACSRKGFGQNLWVWNWVKHYYSMPLENCSMKFTIYWELAAVRSVWIAMNPLRLLFNKWKLSLLTTLSHTLMLIWYSSTSLSFVIRITPHITSSIRFCIVRWQLLRSWNLCLFISLCMYSNSCSHSSAVISTI